MYDISNTDTICAISTPPGSGGIAVIRISGPKAVAITDSIWQGKALSTAADHTAHLGLIIDPNDKSVLDQAVATIYRAGHSFTGDEVVEIATHGSRYIQQRLITILIDAGARHAEPGEFTRRAFLAGRIDLAEAEAVADVIASTSKASHRLALSQLTGTFSQSIHALRDSLITLASLLELELDFSEEDVQFASRPQLLAQATDVARHIDSLADTFATGSALKEGIPVAIIGKPNAGKSTLLNRLLGDDRAIVSDIPGTTRDTIEGTAVHHDILFRYIDTAGLRHTTDTIESLGIDRAFSKIEAARIVILLTTPDDADADIASLIERDIAPRLAPGASLIVATNKIDISAPLPATAPAPHIAARLHISAKTGQGIDSLTHTIAELSGAQLLDTADAIVTNARHYKALTDASASLHRLIQGLQATPPISGDFLAQDLREGLHHLATITGDITTTDLLTSIFSRFCIGK